MTRALLPLADGVEEMEAVILADVLRRARWEVILASVGTQPLVTASRGVRLLADALWDSVRPETFDVLVIPGGGAGAAALARHAGVLRAVRDFEASGKPVAAICAGPLVLQAAGVLKGRRATCHPGVAAELTQAVRVAERVVADGCLLTSVGPGSTFELALALIEHVSGRAERDRVAEGLVLPPGCG